MMNSDSDKEMEKELDNDIDFKKAGEKELKEEDIVEVQGKAPEELEEDINDYND